MSSSRNKRDQRSQATQQSMGSVATYPPQTNFGNDEEALSRPSHQPIPNNAAGTYYAMRDDSTKTATAKSNYILKEQQMRSKALEEENGEMYLSGTSQYGHPSIQSAIADSKDSMFDGDDWTPIDSSYGGAFPFCGWMPKRIRQCIEGFLLVLAVFSMIYFVVTAAIKLTGSGSSNGSSSSFNFDDDHYIASTNDDAEASEYDVYCDDDDDLYKDGEYRQRI